MSLEIGDFVDNDDLQLNNANGAGGPDASGSGDGDGDAASPDAPQLGRRRSQTLPTTLPSSGSGENNTELEKAPQNKERRAKSDGKAKPALMRGTSVKNIGKMARFIGGVANGGTGTGSGSAVRRRGSVGADTYRWVRDRGY